jgi:hypothetical protein
MGVVTVTNGVRRGAKSNRSSSDSYRIQPPGGCFSSEDPKGRPRHEMSLMVEGVVDSGMDAEKTLGGARRPEPLHLALSSPHDLMRVFSAIILSEALVMRAGEAQLTESRAVGAQLVGDQQLRCKALFLEQLAHQPECRLRIAPTLNEHVEDLALVVFAKTKMGWTERVRALDVSPGMRIVVSSVRETEDDVVA